MAPFLADKTKVLLHENSRSHHKTQAHVPFHYVPPQIRGTRECEENELAWSWSLHSKPTRINIKNKKNPKGARAAFGFVGIILRVGRHLARTGCCRQCASRTEKTRLMLYLG
jgi:hypothetical protein